MTGDPDFTPPKPPPTESEFAGHPLYTQPKPSKPYVQVQRVPCPTCGAPAGQGCVNKSGKRHTARLTAALTTP